MSIKREIVRINEELCDGCGLCVPNCAEGAIRIVDGKARIVADKYCDGLGACLGHCPQGALSIEVREADEFDEAAVEELLGGGHGAQPATASASGPAVGHAPRPGGCPSAQLMTMSPCDRANVPTAQKGGEASASALTHWPVQIRLVPPNAPFLQGADLLLTADCVAVALPDYHSTWLPGRTVLMGCPKFDDAEMYIERLAAVFRENELKSVTVLEMEVPCCANMGRITAEAVRRSNRKMSFERVVVARQGRVLARETLTP
ncbi:MAG: ATP-binding protein [Desulfovibrio sp.]